MRISALEDMLAQFNALNEQMSDPDVIASPRYSEVLRQHGQLRSRAESYAAYCKVLETIEESEAIIAAKEDPDLVELAKEELAELKPQQDAEFQKIVESLAIEDDESSKNCIVEMRAGTGGDEASLFVGEIFRAYSHYASKRGWKIDIMNTSHSEVGGFKEMTFTISGTDAFKYFQFESGTHRVQRVPATETQGRVHTSAITVAVLPEAEEIEVEINPAEIRTDYFRSSGPGGQSVNTTDSAVRLTHEPTGITVSCQDEKSQIKNKAKAMKVMRSRLYDRKKAEEAERRGEARNGQIGSGDRSEKIRTYNFPQGRVTDHRANVTLYSLDAVMGGDLEELFEKIFSYFRELKFAELQNG